MNEVQTLAGLFLVALTPLQTITWFDLFRTKNVLNEWKCDVSKMIKAVRYKNKSWILQDTEKNTEKGDVFSFFVCVLRAPK